MEVKCIGVLGDDTTIVNAARVSYRSKAVTTLSASDKKLLNYLAKHGHTSPFRHAVVTFYIKCPEFVARQMYKHIVGANFTSTDPTRDHAWNEVSGRYKVVNDFYIPDTWRRQSPSNRQASIDEPVSNQEAVHKLYTDALDNSIKCYESLLAAGVCKEQARLILPFSSFTEFYWTASFQTIMHFIKLRTHEDSQYEIRLLADRVVAIMQEKFPFAYDAWFGITETELREP